MSLPVVLLQGADADLQEAYESHGAAFDQKARKTLALLAENPEMGRKFRGKIRRLLIPGTPFGVFYVIEGGRILIATVADLRQDPARIRERLGRLG